MNLRTLGRLLWRHAAYQRRLRWDRTRLEAFQQQQLAALLRYACERSPFYRRYHGDAARRPLSDLPILTKAQLMAHFDEIVTDPAITLARVQDHLNRDERGLFRDRYVINTTSGSYGVRGVFLFNQAEWLTVASSYMRLEVAKQDALPARPVWVNIVSTMPSHQTHRIAEMMTGRLFPCVLLSVTDPVASIVERLNALQPHAIATYPSMALTLAHEQLDGRLRIAPKLIRLGGETLTAVCRRVATEAWHCALYDLYGTTETGALAAECEGRHGLHLFEDLAIVENVDDRGRPVPAGMLGERLLVTTLFQRTQPLIRYEITDRLRFSSRPCACGRAFQAVSDIDGRLDETLYFSSAEGRRVPVHWVALYHVMEPLPIKRWQIVQYPDRLVVLVAGAPVSLESRTIVEGLRREIAAHDAIAPAISVQHVEAIPHGATGKAPFFRRVESDAAPASSVESPWREVPLPVSSH